MTYHACVDIFLLAIEGKKFKWQKPSSCPDCGHYLWGHGFVGRYFDDFTDKLWIKRYRCPNCKNVITLTPMGHHKFFRFSLSHIFKTLIHRLSSYQWPPWTTRQRAGHWLQKLKRFCHARFGLNPVGLDLKAKALELSSANINFLDS